MSAGSSAGSGSAAGSFGGGVHAAQRSRVAGWTDRSGGAAAARNAVGPRRASSTRPVTGPSPRAPRRPHRASWSPMRAVELGPGDRSGASRSRSRIRPRSQRLERSNGTPRRAAPPGARTSRPPAARRRPYRHMGPNRAGRTARASAAGRPWSRGPSAPRVQSPGRSTGHERVGERLEGRAAGSPRPRPATARPRTRRTFVSTAPTGQPEGDRRRRPGPCTDRRPGSRSRPATSRREPAAELVDDDPGGPLEVDRAAVVAEAAPCPQDVARRGGGERLDGREPLDEGRPGRPAAGDLGLLEDRLGDEHEIRIGRSRGTGSDDPSPVVPVEDGRTKGVALGLGQERPGRGPARSAIVIGLVRPARARDRGAGRIPACGAYSQSGR